MVFDDSKSSRIKVLYLVSTLAQSGPTTQLWYIIKHMNRDLFEPIVVTLSPEPDNTLFTRFVDAGVLCISLGLSRLSGCIFGPVLLRRLCYNYAPNIVHSISFRGDMISSLFLKDYLRCSTRRSVLLKNGALEYGKLFGPILEVIHLAVLKRLDEVILVSHAAGTWAKKKPLKYKVIPNGIDDNLYRPVDPLRKLSIREYLGIQKDAFVFICSGRLCDLKDPFTIIRAFKGVRREIDMVRLIFIGNGPLKNKCLDLAADTAGIQIMGSVENVTDWLQASDVLVSASLTEAMPNSVLEGMSCGLPVILSDIPAHREILSKNPLAGFFFPPRDVVAAQECFRSISQGYDYHLRSLAAETTVRNCYGAQRMSIEYQQHYKSMLRIQG